MFIFHIFILPRERIQEQFAELDDIDWHSKCHFAGAYFKPCSSWAKSDWLKSVTSSFQGVSTCICASTLGRSGASCSNVNSGANNFICVNANAVALDLKSKIKHNSSSWQRWRQAQYRSFIVPFYEFIGTHFFLSLLQNMYWRYPWVNIHEKMPNAYLDVLIRNSSGY